MRRVWTCVFLFSVAAGASAAAENLRTSYDKPDLSGVWDFRTLTPLERPEKFADTVVLTAHQAAEIEAEAAQQVATSDKASDPNRGAPPEGQSVGGYNRFWLDTGAGVEEDRRTSLIVDPPNGRLPPLQEGVHTQTPGDAFDAKSLVRMRPAGIGADNPENRGLSERCLLGFNSGPPIMPGGYNQNIGITQTPDHVVILNEMVHDARIIPLDDKPRLGVPHWLGESRGHWEGDTLVVETVNFHPHLPSFMPTFFSAVGTAEQLHLTERFQRVDGDMLRYEFTVEDPATFTAPFTGVILMKKTDERIYEYACHEGNYAMRNILAGARLQERLAE